ncbi:tRNA (adenosine(37)-N6)-dimethylallyltransferase MiaA [bacterium]|nr:tRNA (adenosine(37)-N6)-dimethylallyltransferase MiaA [bacterium]
MVSAKREKIVILTGPTAAGKTAVAFALAKLPGCKPIEIINADSLLVYREMNIGTAKPTDAELQKVPHHLINIFNPDQTFTAGDFVQLTNQAIQAVEARGNRPLIVGGTGFYLKALLFGLWDSPKSDPALRTRLEEKSNEELYKILFQADEEAALQIGGNDRYRLVRSVEVLELSGMSPTQLQKEKTGLPADPRFDLWIVDRETKELHQRIALRTQEMLKEGLVAEVEALHRKYPESRALSAVGYIQVLRYLEGVEPEGRKLKSGIEGLTEEIELATRQLVKKQRTWFKGMLKKSEARTFLLDSDLPEINNLFQEFYKK